MGTFPPLIELMPTKFTAVRGTRRGPRIDRESMAFLFRTNNPLCVEVALPLAGPGRYHETLSVSSSRVQGWVVHPARNDHGRMSGLGPNPEPCPGF